MSDVGVDYEGAHSGALSAQEIAGNLRDLPVDFDDLILEAVATTRPDPGVSGWSAFGSEHSDHMMDVQQHAVDLAENIGAGADEIADTDATNTEEFSGAEAPPGSGQLPLIH